MPGENVLVSGENVLVSGEKRGENLLGPGEKLEEKLECQEKTQYDLYQLRFESRTRRKAGRIA